MSKIGRKLKLYLWANQLYNVLFVCCIFCLHKQYTWWESLSLLFCFCSLATSGSTITIITFVTSRDSSDISDIPIIFLNALLCVLGHMQRVCLCSCKKKKKRCIINLWLKKLSKRICSILHFGGSCFKSLDIFSLLHPNGCILKYYILFIILKNLSRPSVQYNFCFWCTCMYTHTCTSEFVREYLADP